MLVLTRRVNERIIIPLPDGIQIQIVPCRIKGDSVRIGISAPPEIEIYRKEIFDQFHNKEGAPQC